MRLAHRAIHNAIFNVAGWAVPVVISFLLMPYIVRSMGEDSYGILTLVWSVIGYFTFLDLGLGQAVTKFVAEHNGRGDVKAVNHIIGAAMLVSAVLGGAGGLCIAAMSDPLAYRWLKIPEALRPGATLAFRIGAIGFVVGMFHTMCRAIPKGLNRYDLTSGVTIGVASLTTGGTALVLYLGGGLTQVVLLNVAIPLLACLSYAWISRRVLPGLTVGFGTSLKPLRQMLNFGLFSILSRISYTVLGYFDRVLIAAVLGTSAVTFYVVPMMLVNKLARLALQVSNVIFPAVSELQGQQRTQAIGELYVAAMRVTMILSTAACIPLMVFGRRLLTLWMGPEFAASSGHVITFVTMSLYIDSLTNVPSFTVDGMGRPDVSGISSVCLTVLTLALMVPLARARGIEGVALSFVASSALIAPLFTWYATRRVVGLPMSTVFRQALVGPWVLGLVLLLVLLQLDVSRIDNVYAMLAVIGASGFAYVVLAVPTGVFAAQERKALLDYLRIPRRRPR